MTAEDSIPQTSPVVLDEPEGELRAGALSGVGVFAQGLAAAAPSVAIASVPGSLFLVAGKGALWAAIVGGVLVYLVATVIALQARRTVSSGSLGTYAGNGLGPVAAFVTGWALIIGYIGFAAGGVLGAVLYFNAFLQEIGLHTDHLAVKIVLLVLATAAALYIPFRGVSVSVKFGLGFEVVSLLAIAIILVASYVTYGARFDGAQFSLSHLGSSATLIAAVTAVGSYAGFESAASLGHEARDAHRNVPRAILRLVIGLGILYLLATYPEVLGFGGPKQLDADSTPLPIVAQNAGVSWVTYAVDLTLGTAMIVFSSAVINSGSRSLFTLSREHALPRALGRVHTRFRTPHVAIAFVGLVGFVIGLIGTVTSVGRFQWDVYVGIVSSYAYLFAYLLVAIATPLWLRRIRALSPAGLVVSVLAVAGIVYVIYKNLIPVPEGAYKYLPYVFLALLLIGLVRFLRLRISRPDVAARVGSIQTLSAAEQERLADLGILDAIRRPTAH
ncbi:amino acid/polyamine/organocation transporter (APC superfamily) [Amycolatopsis sulphurea]|uniref:Amino acid/polyamine/organocation transporter (APC superfamily) n=1 Tax=Amycolatopsis sulphurea TaxID=76022 RepID=A0A2A9FFU7_9PSEU|nr:APC family permease [Amycolatopsis sulphurea]PFG49646.1 amino acid/polyamine/organocation transporter (APC superfamily) [Amycolatopsis sulphurea]